MESVQYYGLDKHVVDLCVLYLLTTSDFLDISFALGFIKRSKFLLPNAKRNILFEDTADQNSKILLHNIIFTGNYFDIYMYNI